MEKDVQHAVVASIEITEPGERLGLLIVDDDEVPVTDLDFGFAVLLTAVETTRGVAAWIVGMDIVPLARSARDVCGLSPLETVDAMPLAMGMALGVPGSTRKIMPATAMALTAAAASERGRAAIPANLLSREGLACRCGRPPAD